MRVLIVGAGGREAALAWAVRNSVFVNDVLCAPGNAGIALYAKCMPVGAEDTWGLLKLAEEKNIDLTIVGPELPLVRGIVDVFERHGQKIIGPCAGAARVEASKAYAKELFRRFDIPTADFAIFARAHRAKEFIRAQKMPLVIKADGLAGGKGVRIAHSQKEAFCAVDELLNTPAGRRIVVEEYLSGTDCSFIGLADGENFFPFPPSLDYKRISRTSEVMTGGVGCVAPHPFFIKAVDAEQDRRRLAREKQIQEIFQKLLNALASNGYPYRGVLYGGFMLTAEGPKLLEVNCRFGDPETQAIMPLLRYPDFLSLLLATINPTNNLKYIQAEWDNQTAVCVTLIAEGYPGKPRTGDRITGLDEVGGMEHVHVFHAGIRVGADGAYVTAGGRVLQIVGLGKSISEARARAYEAVRRIKFRGMWYRDDIGILQE